MCVVSGLVLALLHRQSGPVLCRWPDDKEEPGSKTAAPAAVAAAVAAAGRQEELNAVLQDLPVEKEGEIEVDYVTARWAARCRHGQWPEDPSFQQGAVCYTACCCSLYPIWLPPSKCRSCGGVKCTSSRHTPST